MFKKSFKSLSKSGLAATLTTLSTLSASCMPNSNSENGGLSGGAHLSEIKIAVSGLDTLVAKDGSKPVTGLHLTIIPDSACTAGKPIDKVISVSNSPAIQEKIAKGCNYEAKLSLGKLSSDSSTLTDVYYETTEASKITAEQSKEDKVPLRLAPQLTAAGKAIGLPEKSGGTPSEPVVTPDSLPAKINVQVTSASGSVALDKVFTTPYLLIDFSRLGCPPCVDLGKENESKSSFQSMTTGAKCRAMTIVPAGQNSDWATAIGGESAKTTFEYKGGHNGFASLFGATVSATPTVILVDRTGKVIDEATGRVPSKFESMCR
jgi:thioredoxin-related protein